MASSDTRTPANVRRSSQSQRPDGAPHMGARPAGPAGDSPSAFRREGSASSTSTVHSIPNVPIKEESASDSDAGSEPEAPLRSFEPKTSLPPAKLEHRSLQDLMDLLKDEALVLDPEYQRDVVWDRKRMVGLIDSVMENYYIPPIIFNKKIDRSRGRIARIQRICIDGKQRLSSIKAFMAGKIGCHDRQGNVWYYAKEAEQEGTSIRRVLPEDVKAEFRSKKFICFEYPNLQPSQEEDLFSRVQKGVQLSSAEKFRATTGPWQEFAKQYERDFTRVVKLASIGRSAGFNNLLMSFAQVIEVRNSSASNGRPKFKTPASTIQGLFNNKKDYNPETRDLLRRTFSKFHELVEKDPQTFMDNGYYFAKLFSPFEMVACSVIISMFMERDDSFLLKTIRLFRLHLREKLRDLRMNKDSWAVAWGFIEKLRDPYSPLQQQIHLYQPPNVTPWHRPSNAAGNAELRTDAESQLQMAVAARTNTATPVLEARLNPLPSQPVQAISSPRPYALMEQPTASSSSFSPLLNARLDAIPGNLISQPSRPAVQHPHVASLDAQLSRAVPVTLDPTASSQTSVNIRSQQASLPLVQSIREHQGQVSETNKPSSGIHKKRLARFTTSGSGKSASAKAGPSAPARVARPPPSRAITAETAEQATAQAEILVIGQSTRQDHTEQSGQQGHNKRGPDTVIELSSGDERTDAEELLAKFKPYPLKRVKVEDEREG